VFVEAKSGKRADNRAELQAALSACGKGTVLVVYSLSRLARSTRDTIEIADWLSKVGADLVSLSERLDTTTAAGKMVFRLLAVLAEFERDQIAERTRTALQHKKSQGERVGSVPYGCALAADGVHLAADPTEQEIIALVKRLWADRLSLRAFAERLEAAGYQPRGKSWHAQSIANILEAAA
jgi:DNA invertase Pin-like site-specific DNA recombinase